MKLALVYPPFFAKVFNENLPTVDDEFGLFPHIGFGWVARAAKAAGWQVRLWDVPATKQTLNQVVAELEAYSPDLVGFSAHAAQSIRDMLSWAQAIKQRTGLPTLVGGYEAKVYVDELMGHRCFDYLYAGEAHTGLPELLRACERGHGHEKVANLAFWRGSSLHKTRSASRPPFSEFATPDRSIFPNHLYYSHVSQRQHFTIGMSEIGCPYSCSFCCIRRSGFDARTAEQVVAEMEECVALGIREIDWFDPIMLHDRQRALDIAREVKRRKLDMVWSCRSRIDTLSFRDSTAKPDDELIEALAEGGCRRIYIGLESGDDGVLRAMRKDQSTGAGVRATLAATQEAGIMPLGFFMLGAPSDTRRSVSRTVSYALSLPLSYAQFQIAVIKPHTELEKKILIEGLGIDYWREYVKGTIDELLLPSPCEALDRAELEKLARLAYLRFYSRPGYALSMLRRIESVGELVRYARVFAQLVSRPLRPSAVLSVASRAGRAALAFGESLLTLSNPGVRHPAFKHGGGLRGALAQAATEWQRKGSEEAMLTAELAQRYQTPTTSWDRYVPYFEAPDTPPSRR